MHSDFVIALRKVAHESARFINAEESLFEHYCSIQKIIKNKALSQPKLLKQFALNTLEEIKVENDRIKKYIERAQDQIKITTARKDTNNMPIPSDLKELEHWDSEFQYYQGVLTNIADVNATLIEYLAAYYPEDFVKNDLLLVQLREYLPILNLYRKKIERLIIDHSFDSTSGYIGSKEMSPEEQANLVIGKINFEKAQLIICEDIAKRMPDTLNRIDKLRNLSAEDRLKFELYRGISKDEVVGILVGKISKKRESVINSYKSILNKINTESVDPDFTSDLTKKSVIDYILNNKQYFISLRQHPSGWNNIELFGDLWGHSFLLTSWQAKNKPSKLNISLKELFENPIVFDECVAILRSVDPPVISTSNSYIGNLKGAMCVWIDELKRAGILKTMTDRSIYAKALFEYFKGFSISESMFAKPQTRAVDRYEMQFRQMISKIPHSPN